MIDEDSSFTLPTGYVAQEIMSLVFTFDQITALADEIVKHLSYGPHFCVWLSGPLGAGKTTLVSSLLYRLGLSGDIPVLLPTYTIMGDYAIAGSWYAHLDLYRLLAQSSLEELGLLDAHPYQGLFVEWPERCLEDPCIQPTHLIELGYGSGDLERRIVVYKISH